MTPTLRLLPISALLIACPGDTGSSTTTDAGSTGNTTGNTTGSTTAASDSSTDTPTTSVPTTGGDASTSGEPGSTSTADSTGASGTTGEPADEQVTLLDTPCEKSPPAATGCERYEVTCAGLAPAIVDLAIYAAKDGAPSKGTVLFGSGGDGTGFYNFTETKALNNAGYTVVERRWPAGWFTGGTDGPQQTACRLAALIRHLRATPPASGPLCATGNSGGSAELGYALTWQAAAPSLDFAMPTSGPFHRLDLACQGEADPDWPDQCDALRQATCPDCASKGCQLGNGPRSLMDIAFADTPRCTKPGPGDLALLAERGPELGPDVPELGDLPIHFMIGKDDPGAYEPLATALHDSLLAGGAAVDIDYITGVLHEMDSVLAGGDAIRDAILTRCVPLP